MRAGHIGYLCGRSGPPASLSSALGLMHHSSPTVRTVAAALCIAVVALAIGFWHPRGSMHPQFGRVYRSSADQLGTAKRVALWLEHHLPVGASLARSVDSRAAEGPTLTIGTNRLYCSMRSERTKAGWLALWVPFSTNGVWEFARCDRTNLMEVTPADLNSSFVGVGDPHGAAVFGPDWATNSVCVWEGEIVFAKRVGQIGPVYVIRFARTGWKTQIEYFLMPTNRPANHSMERTGASRADHLVCVAQCRLAPAAHAGR